MSRIGFWSRTASNVSERKLDETREEKDAAPSVSSESGGTAVTSGFRASLLLLFLLLYQIAMATEMRLRVLFSRCDHLIVDRSYIDDLVTGKIDEATFLDRYYSQLDELMQLGKEELGL